MFAYEHVVLTMKSYSAWAGGCSINFDVADYCRTTDEAVQLVPKELRQAAVGLGATDFQTVTRGKYCQLHYQ